jgi:hypothetical protein
MAPDGHLVTTAGSDAPADAIARTILRNTEPDRGNAT